MTTALSVIPKGIILYWVVNDVIGSEAASVIFGGILANAALSWTEMRAMTEFYFARLGGKVRNAAKSHPWARNILDFFNYSAWGPGYTLPIAMLGIKATEGWSPDKRLAVLLFLCYTESFRNARKFNVLGNVVTAYERLKARWKMPSDAYMVDKLKQVFEETAEEYHHLSHKDLQNVLAMLEDRDPEGGLPGPSSAPSGEVAPSAAAAAAASGQASAQPLAKGHEKDEDDGKRMDAKRGEERALPHESAAAQRGGALSAAGGDGRLPSAAAATASPAPQSAAVIEANGRHDALAPAVEGEEEEDPLLTPSKKPSGLRIAYVTTLKLIYFAAWFGLLYSILELLNKV